MAASSSILQFLITLFLVTVILFPSVARAGEHHLDWIQTRPTCHGSIAECEEADGEFDMDSEINRRILATRRYISYEALKRNSVPCSRRGASYYNCRPGAQANPYSRGCSAITRCRS